MASMDHDDAMLRLNDQVGRHVVVFVVRGDCDIAVIGGEGRLRHWSSDDPSGLIQMTETARRLAGCYVVGESTVLNVGEDQGAASWSDMVEADGLDESETGIKAVWPDGVRCCVRWTDGADGDDYEGLSADEIQRPVDEPPEAA
jgi:hypothetical protein